MRSAQVSFCFFVENNEAKTVCAENVQIVHILNTL